MASLRLEGRPMVVGFAAAGALAAAAAAVYVWWPAVARDTGADGGAAVAGGDGAPASQSRGDAKAVPDAEGSEGAEDDGPAPAVDAGDPAGQCDDGERVSDDDFVMVAADALASPASDAPAAAPPAAAAADGAEGSGDADAKAEEDAESGKDDTRAAVLERIDALHMSSDVDGVEKLLAPLRAAVGRGGDSADDAQVLWRCARNAKCMADHAATDASKARRYGEPTHLYSQAVELAEQALAANERDAGAHKWASIAYAKVGNGTKEKIANAYKIRDHAQRSIELDPSDPAVHHVLGQFCAGVAKLSWLERKAAAALFGEPPSSTYEEALAHLERAEELKPGFYVGNRVALAQMCVALGNKAQAREWVRRAMDMPRLPEEAEDWKALEELQRQLG